MDTRIERFQTIYANLRSKGYSDEAAQNLAVEAMEQEASSDPPQSRRFQLLNGEQAASVPFDPEIDEAL
jgi:formiminotetrahydrofolate cyclodeaminase